MRWILLFAQFRIMVQVKVRRISSVRLQSSGGNGQRSLSDQHIPGIKDFISSGINNMKAEKIVGGPVDDLFPLDLKIARRIHFLRGAEVRDPHGGKTVGGAGEGDSLLLFPAGADYVK